MAVSQARVRGGAPSAGARLRSGFAFWRTSPLYRRRALTAYAFMAPSLIARPPPVRITGRVGSLYIGAHIDFVTR
jgi:hypothetical protein